MSIALSDIEFNRKLINWAGVLLALLTCLRPIEGVNIPLPILTCVCVVVIMLCATDKHTMVCVPAIAFLGIYAVSLLIHPQPQFFLRAARFLAFCIGLAMFSPMISNSRLANIRGCFFKISMWLMSLMVVVSFGILIYCMVTHKPISDHTYFYYGFKGVCDNGMTLSPMAALVAIFALYKSINSQSPIKVISWLSLFVIGMITCVGAGSRIAVAGMAIAIIAMVIMSVAAIKAKLNNPSVRIALICGSIVVMVMTPPALKVVNYKNKVAKEHNSMIYSRKSIWETRVAEIKSSPFIGIGYANEFHRSDSKNAPIDLTIIEPGSGWLSLLSYGGILGFGTFIWFLINLCHKLRNRWQSADYRQAVILTVGLLAFFFIDCIAEGWLFFPGSLMFPFFWSSYSITFNTSSLI